MKVNTFPGDLSNTRTDCLIIGIHEKNKLSSSAEVINKATKGYIAAQLKTNALSGEIGSSLLLTSPPHIGAKHLLLIGIGGTKPLSARNYRKINHLAASELNKYRIAKSISTLCETNVGEHDFKWKAKHATESFADANYQITGYKSKSKPNAINQILIHTTNRTESKHAKQGIDLGLAVATGVEYAKDLGNAPANICNPTYLAKQAEQLAKSFPKLTCKVLSEADMKKLGMGSFMSVSQGSPQPGKMVFLHYKGAEKSKAPYVFVGKGITFDTGGNSLKPADAMVGMKYDMCGAATVLGLIKSCATMKLPLNVIGVMACAENTPGGAATRPEDIVTSMSGQTIEILNTDAEGRLVLCDALTYCEKFKPKAIVDIATLTGAAVIALGTHTSALLTNHQPLADKLLDAGQESFDRAWQLPLWEEYDEQLKSDFADMANIGGRTAGTITAAAFLSRFTKKMQWAHLDVAGTAASMMAGKREAHGRPVPLLMQYLINQARL